MQPGAQAGESMKKTGEVTTLIGTVITDGTYLHTQLPVVHTACIRRPLPEPTSIHRRVSNIFIVNYMYLHLAQKMRL